MSVVADGNEIGLVDSSGDVVMYRAGDSLPDLPVEQTEAWAAAGMIVDGDA